MTVVGTCKQLSISLCIILSCFLSLPFELKAQQEKDVTPQTHYGFSKTIYDIKVRGNKTTDPQTIIHALPYKVGESFDKTKTSDAIKNVWKLGRFENVYIKSKPHNASELILVIDVVEKTALKDVIIEGNKAITDREIFKKLNFDDVHTISQAELKNYAQQIRNMYLEKGYHKAIIETELHMHKDGETATGIFTIQEGKQAIVKRIVFDGNEHMSDKRLRAALITQEDWLLGFVNKAGSYHPEKTEADKYMLEQYYQNNGFLNARVTNVDTFTNPDNEHITLTFSVEEDDEYRFGTIHAPGNDILSDTFLEAILPVQPGGLYSREKLSSAIRTLETIWGDHGYIFAHINPSIQPNKETKTVDVTFHSELGDPVTLRRITIKGNKKTRDKVIRRNLSVQEGSLITKRLMESSKRNVSSLGYFDPKDGVTWKTIRVTPDTADLDLMVKEAKTGNAGFQLSFGGKGISSPSSGVTASLNYTETNLFGYGTHINANASWAANEKTAQLHFAQPWLFDKPITAALDIYHRRPSYNQLKLLLERSIHERVTGGALTGGYITPPYLSIFHNTHLRTSIGVDSVRYERPATAGPIANNNLYQTILDKEFTPGDFAWLSFTAEQDIRNHPIHTSRGHRVRFGSRVAFPTFNDCIGFYSLDLDAHWYTPLIDERTLVFHLHGYAGYATPLSGRAIPFGSLYHIGGESSVRGFNFGDIGPQFGLPNHSDTIGATKAFFVNAELIFPINPDMTMKGVFFYDGGSGWDNPYVPTCPPDDILGNSFDYRHSIGFGIRVLNPMPIRIDWGFKIDPRDNETSHQVHFSTSYDW